MKLNWGLACLECRCLKEPLMNPTFGSCRMAWKSAPPDLSVKEPRLERCILTSWTTGTYQCGRGEGRNCSQSQLATTTQDTGAGRSALSWVLRIVGAVCAQNAVQAHRWRLQSQISCKQADIWYWLTEYFVVLPKHCACGCGWGWCCFWFCRDTDC